MQNELLAPSVEYLSTSSLLDYCHYILWFQSASKKHWWTNFGSLHP